MKKLFAVVLLLGGISTFWFYEPPTEVGTEKEGCVFVKTQLKPSGDWFPLAKSEARVVEFVAQGPQSFYALREDGTVEIVDEEEFFRLLELGKEQQLKRNQHIRQQQ